MGEEPVCLMVSWWELGLRTLGRGSNEGDELAGTLPSNQLIMDDV
jgi:hypothetical protein